jgi:hypothetical protein
LFPSVSAPFTKARIRSGTVAIDESFHEERKPAALKRDESHVNLMREHVKQRMTNPFDVASHPKSLQYRHDLLSL